MRKWLPVLIVLVGLGSSISSAQFGIIDCIEQGRLVVPKVQGGVYDAAGFPVAGALVSLSSDTRPEVQSKTDAAGLFHINASPGRYLLRASSPNFETTRAELDVGSDVLNVLHPIALRVILALPGVNCPWVTASNKEFKKLGHNHATQK
jgi:hypothetical protein